MCFLYVCALACKAGTTHDQLFVLLAPVDETQVRPAFVFNSCLTFASAHKHLDVIKFIVIGTCTSSHPDKHTPSSHTLHTQNALPDVLAVVQVALEGAISAKAATSSLARGELPQGDLIPWTIGQQYQVRSLQCVFAFASVSGPAAWPVLAT